jgi:hypothetical protein
MLKREGERRQKVVDEAAAAENAMKAGGGSNAGEGCVAYNDKGMQSTTKHIN